MTGALELLDVGPFAAQIRPSATAADLIEAACKQHREILADAGDVQEAETANALASLFGVHEHGLYLGRPDLQVAADAVQAHKSVLQNEGHASETVEHAAHDLAEIIAQVDEAARATRSKGGRA